MHLVRYLQSRSLLLHFLFTCLWIMDMEDAFHSQPGTSIARLELSISRLQCGLDWVSGRK